ncbi:LysR family transcriptional regulator [Sphingomonas sp. GM_Shp_2]|uniref:LysR family transcriptional regulator n=1 Tax=Sphingomonas sp. GM_Shp_2 TaxID=2937380 RepID=UPI00226A667B|nr:LysR family transcriptional regulator [Sphingomonas sp. GM_Shp_2]
MLRRSGIPNLEDLRAFHAVAECGNFSVAARRLNLAKSTLSKRVSDLEAVIGEGLLRRSSREMSLTDRGAALFPLAAAAARLYGEVADAVIRPEGQLSGRVNVSCSIMITQRALAPVLRDFLHENPNVEVRVHASNRQVDLYAEGFDIGLRAHRQALSHQSLLKRTIAEMPWNLAAAPSYLETLPTVRTPEDLERHIIGFFGMRDDDATLTFHGEGGVRSLWLSPRVRLDDMTGLLEAALTGVGVVALPLYLMAGHIAAGDLQVVLPQWQLPVSQLSILTAPRGQGSPAVSRFADHLAKTIPTVLRASCHLRRPPL